MDAETIRLFSGAIVLIARLALQILKRRGTL